MSPPLHRSILLSFLAATLTGCSLLGAMQPPMPPGLGGPILVTADPRATETPTPFLPFVSTPTISPSPTALPSPTAAPTLPPPPTATNPAPTQVATPTTRPQYLLQAEVDYLAHRLEVEQTISYTNQSADTLSQLVLAVEPNFWTSGFVLYSVTVNGTVDYDVTLSSHQMTISLPDPLPPGGAVLVGITYQLNVPEKAAGLIYGYTDYQMNLVDWFPFVVPYLPGRGWVLHDVYPWGENLVYDSADFEVNLRFADPFNAPVVAASSLPEANGEWTRYRLYGARTFAFSMSPYFLTSQGISNSGVPVFSYYFDGHRAAGEAIAQTGAQAVSVFSSTFGAYPYPSLSIVETIISDGMEQDGLVFLNTRYYTRYDGSLANELTALGVHEMSHQWWFGQVGNDQMLEPWLDEAVSVYSEHVFYENTAPHLLSWWWQYRVEFFEPSGWVDTTVYQGGSFRQYVNAVYLEGAHFMQALRDRMGDEAFFAFLADYAARNDRRIATADDFFSIVREHSGADLQDLISAYFQNLH